MAQQLEIRPIDQQRAGRVVLALLGDDGDSVLRVLSEAMADPSGGVLALVLALGKYSAEMARAIDPDNAEGRIIAALLTLTADSEGPDLP